VAKLKEQELEPAIREVCEGKQSLADVYYDPGKMLKWRDICTRQFESLKGKVDKLAAACLAIGVTKKMSQCLSSL